MMTGTKRMIRTTSLSVLSAMALAASWSFGLAGSARGQAQTEVPTAVMDDFHRTCAGEIGLYTRLGTWVREPDRLFRTMMDVQETRAALQRLDAQITAEVRQLPANTDAGTRAMLNTTAALRHCAVRLAMRYTPDSVAARPAFAGQWVPFSRADPGSAYLVGRLAELTIVPQPDGLAVTSTTDGISGLYVEQPRAADGRSFRRDLPGGASLRIRFYDADGDAMRFEDGDYHADMKRVIVRSFAPNPDPPPQAAR